MRKVAKAVHTDGSQMSTSAMESAQDKIPLSYWVTQRETVLTRSNLLIAAALSIAALLMIASFDRLYGINIWQPSSAPHYLYQAEAFLHERWNIAMTSQSPDVISLHGLHYIIYPPFPAIAMLPFVAIWGLNTSDVAFTAIVAALGVGALFLVFEQARANALTSRPWTEHALMTIFLFFGSIYWWLSLGGRVWFTAQIVCVVCTLIGLLLALRRHFFAAALMLMLAFFSRPTALFGYIFLLALAWENAGLDPQLRRFIASVVHAIRRRDARLIETDAIPWRRVAPVLAALALLITLFALRNIMLFGSPLETGYDLLIQQRYLQIHYGQFSLSYVPANVVANFFNFPLVTFPNGPWDTRPVIDMSNRDMSISVFITTPLFLFLFWRNQTWSVLRVALWVTITLVVIETLLFNASGWQQFGARYLFDGYPFAFLLLALNETRIDWRFMALGVLGVLINSAGAIQFWAHLLLAV